MAIRAAPWALVLACCATAASSYSHSEGQTYVRFAQAAYCSADGIAAWTCNVCDSDVRDVTAIYNDISNIQAYAGYRSASNEVVVAFRGTVGTSIRNWVEDLDAFQTVPWAAKCAACAVHSGFYGSYSSVSDKLVSAVKSLRSRHPSAAVVVTGHSLGGAMAAVAAADLAVRIGVPVAKLVTYGEPRTGNAAFADLISSSVPTVWRITHLKDIVPHVPLTEMGFQHLSTEVYYSSDSDYKVCSGREDPSCSAQWSVLDLSVPDHLRYLSLSMGSGSC